MADDVQRREIEAICREEGWLSPECDYDRHLSNHYRRLFRRIYDKGRERGSADPIIPSDTGDADRARGDAEALQADVLRLSQEADQLRRKLKTARQPLLAIVQSKNWQILRLRRERDDARDEAVRAITVSEVEEAEAVARREASIEWLEGEVARLRKLSLIP